MPADRDKTTLGGEKKISKKDKTKQNQYKHKKKNQNNAYWSSTRRSN